MIKLRNSKISLQIFLSTLITVLIAGSIVSAATTIDSNINTGGTLTVTGATGLTGALTLTTASSTGLVKLDSLQLTTALADAYVADNITASNYLPLAGGTMAGALNLTTASSTGLVSLDSLQLTTALADAYVADNITASNYLPLSASTSLNYLPLTGGTMAGNVAFSGAQTVDGIDISSIPTTYLTIAASTSIVSLPSLATVGTITSGTWNGTALTDANVADNITASNYLPLSASTSLNYLPLTGGTLSGALVFDTASSTGSGATSVKLNGLTVYGDATITGILTAASITFNGAAITNVTSLTASGAVNFGTASSTGLASLDSLAVGGGYGSTGLSIDTSGNLQANGNVTIDGNTALTGTLGVTGNTVLTTASSTGLVKVGSLQINNGTTILQHLSNSAAVNFDSMATSTCNEKTLAVTGAASGDTVVATPIAGIESGLVWSAWVSAGDTITIRACNINGTNPLDPASIAWRADVWKH